MIGKPKNTCFLLYKIAIWTHPNAWYPNIHTWSSGIHKTTDWEWNHSTRNRTNVHVEDTGQIWSGSHLHQNKGARRRQMQYWTKQLWIVISNWIIGSKTIKVSLVNWYGCCDYVYIVKSDHSMYTRSDETIYCIGNEFTPDGIKKVYGEGEMDGCRKT